MTSGDSFLILMTYMLGAQNRDVLHNWLRMLQQDVN